MGHWGDPRVIETKRRSVRKIGTIGLAASAVAVLLAAGLAGALPPAAGLSGLFGGPGPGGGEHGSPFPTPIRHVFLIVMENEGTDQIYGVEPYETKLANTYAFAGDANSNPQGVGYYAVCHPSAPNYLALTSGQPLQCGSDSYHHYSVNNLGNLLQTAGESWVAWAESATQPCQEKSAGEYAVKHMPFPYFSDLGGNASGSVCSTHVLPIANLTDDYPYSATPPAFTYIAPNLLNDGHDTSANYADAWLSGFIPKLIAQPWFSSSVIFITYDESYGASPDSGYSGLAGGPVYTVAVSPYTLGMGVLGGNSSHYNLLTTTEWLLGLPGTGTGNDSTPEFPAMTGLFQPWIFGPGANLPYTDLLASDLAGYDLRADNLQYADLAGADLQGSDLRWANLQYANLAGADLQGANLQGANLQYANLAGADLQGAQLTWASLQYADLGGATLTGLGSLALTDFDGADLYHAVLTGAVCGSPNYISAFGANIEAVGVPSGCSPPL
jgi:phosphatidylinositol-3-phosphatase